MLTTIDAIDLGDVFARSYQLRGMDVYTLRAVALAIRDLLPTEQQSAFVGVATMSGLTLDD